MIHAIVLGAFPGMVTEKAERGEDPVWLFKGIDIMPLADKILLRMYFLFVAFFSLFSVLFWQTLLIDASHNCDLSDKHKECFEYDRDQAVKFWKAFESMSKSPVDCTKPEVINGTVALFCYRLVFRPGTAAGVSYGAFKLFTIALSIATSAMLLHKKPRNVRRTRIIVGVLFVVLYAALFAFAFIESKKKEPLFDMGRMDSAQTASYFQAIAGFMGVVCFVFYIPWKELVQLKLELDDDPDRESRPLISSYNRVPDIVYARRPPI